MIYHLHGNENLQESIAHQITYQPHDYVHMHTCTSIRVLCQSANKDSPPFTLRGSARSAFSVERAGRRRHDVLEPCVVLRAGDLGFTWTR